MKIPENSSLIVVDVQNDFCPGGSLEVMDGDKIIPVINSLMPKFMNIVFTQDWHPESHLSMASSHEGRKPYDIIDLNGAEQVLWPDHCIQGSNGAELHKDLDKDKYNILIRKGMNKNLDSYSAFFENDLKTETGLKGYLQNLGIDSVYICGLATDYCVYYTVLGAIRLGFKTSLIIDACKGVNFPEGSVNEAINHMSKAGAAIVTGKEILSNV